MNVYFSIYLQSISTLHFILLFKLDSYCFYTDFLHILCLSMSKNINCCFFYFRVIMPRRCSVAGCRSGYDTEKEKTNTFSLPKEESLRLKWLKKIPNDVSKFKQPVVCIKHFTESSIIRVDHVTVNGEPREYPRVIPKLAKNAVPTIFPNLSPSVERLAVKQEETFDSANLQSVTEHKKYVKGNSINSIDGLL